MYKRILVPVDNSPLSNAAMNTSVSIAKGSGARVAGSHIFAARLHEGRFRQMEPGLPDKYQEEDVLQHQRDIHQSLIGNGLQLISDSYLDVFDNLCRRADITFERKTVEGRNYIEIAKEAKAEDYDLLVLGAHGLGRTERSLVGSVCERVANLVRQDVLVIRDDKPLNGGSVLVAVDGSVDSFAAMRRAISFSQQFGMKVTAVAVYDPRFHSVAFRGIAGVLSSEAAALFRFEEQERLHDELINAGLKKVYESDLLKAVKMAEAKGLVVENTVLEGKPFEEILNYADKIGANLIIVGRFGIHKAEGTDMGSHTTNLLRLAPCNFLIAHEGERSVADNLTIQEEGSLIWTVEAEKCLERVPPFARPMARRGIEEFAREKGYPKVTEEVFDQARQRFGM